MKVKFPELLIKGDYPPELVEECYRNALSNIIRRLCRRAGLRDLPLESLEVLYEVLQELEHASTRNPN